MRRRIDPEEIVFDAGENIGSKRALYVPKKISARRVIAFKRALRIRHCFAEAFGSEIVRVVAKGLDRQASN